MKRFSNPFANGGIGFQNEDWNTAQGEPLEAAESIVKGLEPCILSGGEITSLTPTTISINAGLCLLEGKIMRFDAYSGAHGFLVADTPTVTQRQTQAGATADFSTTYKATYSATQGGGDFIRLYDQPYQYFNQILFRQSHAKGSIVMLSSATTEIFGESIPTIDGTGGGLGYYFGFHLCDGTNGTIDLQDKFIKGASLGDLGNEGGQSTINLEHNHQVLKTVSNAVDIVGFDQGGAETSVTFSGGTVSAGSGINVPNVANTDFNFYSDKQLSNSQNIEPPHYQLYYLQRV